MILIPIFHQRFPGLITGYERMAIRAECFYYLDENICPPHTTYYGTWGGYAIRFDVEGRPVEMKVNLGIRTPCAPCRIVVDGTWPEVKVDTITKEMWEKESGRKWVDRFSG